MLNETDFAYRCICMAIFRVLAIDGVATPHREWRDTVIMARARRMSLRRRQSGE